MHGSASSLKLHLVSYRSRYPPSTPVTYRVHDTSSPNSITYSRMAPKHAVKQHYPKDSFPGSLARDDMLAKNYTRISDATPSTHNFINTTAHRAKRNTEQLEKKHNNQKGNSPNLSHNLHLDDKIQTSISS